MGGRSLRVLTDVSSLENLCIPASSKAFLEALTLDVWEQLLTHRVRDGTQFCT